MFTNTLSNEEMTKIKVVDSDVFNNFYVRDFIIQNHIKVSNSCLKLSFIEIQILNCSNFVK